VAAGEPYLHLSLCDAIAQNFWQSTLCFGRVDNAAPMPAAQLVLPTSTALQGSRGRREPTRIYRPPVFSDKGPGLANVSKARTSPESRQLQQSQDFTGAGRGNRGGSNQQRTKNEGEQVLPRGRTSAGERPLSAQTTPLHPQQLVQQPANSSHREQGAARKLKPSGYDMQPADKPVSTVLRGDTSQRSQSGRMGAQTTGARTTGAKGFSETYTKFETDSDQERQAVLAQDEAMARRLVEQQEAEDQHAVRQAILEEETMGPLAKMMQVQASTVWGRVASGAISADTQAGSAVNANQAAAIGKTLQALADKTGIQAMEAGEELARLIQMAGIQAFVRCGVVSSLRNMLQLRHTAEGALYGIKGCCELLGGKAEPFMLPFLPNVLHLVADKKSQGLRTAALETGVVHTPIHMHYVQCTLISSHF